MSKKYLLSIYALVGIALILAFVTGFVIHDVVDLHAGGFPIFDQAYAIIKDQGYSELPPNPAIEYGMIRGLVNAYGDPFTSFIEPAQHELENDELQGSFGGVGVRLVRTDDGSFLLYPIPDGPAAAAGVQDADELIAVDEVDISPDIKTDEVVAAVRGPVGESVTIKIRRQGASDPLEFSIPRESVPLPSVTWHIAPDNPEVGIVEINLFASSTKDETLNAFEDLEAKGATRYILDLRDNGGGLLDAGVDTARLFLSDGTIIEQQFRGESVEAEQVDRPGPLVEVPLLVLINQNTASAAEILAGSLQNLGRAQIVGHRSFGKDSIQKVFELSDGSSIHVTAARWWLPDNDPTLSETGLEPDIIVDPGDSDNDLVMKAAIDAFNRQ
jgi:carboxyl-terminal processing protease